jgi:hypothetical protein
LICLHNLYVVFILLRVFVFFSSFEQDVHLESSLNIRYIY